MITIKTRSEEKVTVTQKWYATLRNPKMHPHTKFGIPTSKNIGRYAPDTKRVGQTDSAITICLPKFLGGHKNIPLYLIKHLLQLEIMSDMINGL